MKQVTMTRAMARLRRELSDDPLYFRAWQANIAMAFYDAYYSDTDSDIDIHATANKAAKNFLNMLCGGEK